MKIKHVQDGFELHHSNGEVLFLTENEAWAIYHTMDRKIRYQNLIAGIRCILDVDWNFTQSKEEVINNDELINDMIDSLDFEDENILHDYDTLLDFLDECLSESANLIPNATE